MRITILVCLCLLYSVVSIAGVIVSGEFFVDTDPGEGSGTYIDGIYYTDSVTVNTNYNTTGLSFGCHWMFVRFKDAVHWGKPQASLFWNIDPNGKSIIAGEYYFDTDPGVGCGEALEGNFGNQVVTANYNNFDTSNLTIGTHFLYVRFMDSSFQWGNAQATILNISNPAQCTIECGEYFIDTDPGLGQAEALPGSYNGSVFVASTLNIPTYMISEGNHNVYVRFKDTNGNWGSVSSYRITVVHDAPELIKNGGCEETIVTTYDIPNWEEITGNRWGNTDTGFSAYEGTKYFFPGAVANAELRQDVDVSGYKSYIDAGIQNFVFTGWVRSYPQTSPTPNDSARIVLEYLNSSKSSILYTFDTGYRADIGLWAEIQHSHIAPIGTGYIRIRLISKRPASSGNNNGCYDCLSLKAPLANGPQFSNITVLQREDETKKVDIYYSVSHDQPLTISLQVSKDNGATWDVPCTVLSGDIGSNISPGLGKHIIWNVLLDQPDINYSNYVFRLVATDGVLYGSITSGQVEIDAVDENYSSYRIVPVSQAPNPAILEIPEGGYGYAWFKVEGFRDNVWLPIYTSKIEAIDEQGNIIQAKTGFLPYKFLRAIVSMQNIGVFALPVKYNMIGSGAPNNTETITVYKVNNELLTSQNTQHVECKVIAYKYTCKWGYRLNVQLGIGANTLIFSGLGFGGGGCGATIELDLAGLGSNPEYNALRIVRRDDLFLGVECEFGPPKLISLSRTGFSGQVSFPYEYIYSFDYDNMEGMDALMAFYLFMEPVMLKPRAKIFGKQISLDFISMAAQFLIDNNAGSALNISRISDETGLDVDVSGSFSTDFLSGVHLGLEMDASVGGKTHFTSSEKITTEGIKTKTLQLEGALEASIGIGPRFVPFNNDSYRHFCLNELNGSFTAPVIGVGFEVQTTWLHEAWQSTSLFGSVETNLIALNVHHLPGQTQKIIGWIEINDIAKLNMLYNITQIPAKVAQIGSAAVDFAINNESFSQDYANFLSFIYEQQNNDLPVQIPYGSDLVDKTKHSLQVKLPLPLLAAFDTSIGFGIDISDERDYNISKGNWVKGYPYLQTEMENPPQPQVSFQEVIRNIWDKFTSGSLWSQFSSVLMSHINNIVHRRGSRNRQIDILNDRGSFIEFSSNSFPVGIDSIVSRNWDWRDDPQRYSGRAETKSRIVSYNQKMRRLREEVVGMHYGIGGFYMFDCEEETWNQEPSLTIKYLDSEVTGINESSLKMFWEDSLGVWHVLPSSAVPDSNLVRADIPNFATYTLAPSLPQGTFNMSASPDSIQADGISTTQITSSAIYNNDGSVVSNGTKFTVVLNRGEITTPDADLSTMGKQVVVQSGCITFAVQADSIPIPIIASVSSTHGFADGTITIPVYKLTNPAAPVIISAQPEHRSLNLVWQPVNDPSVIGYKIYYDSDIGGAPYSGVSNVNGCNSPIMVGNNNSYTISGLNNGQSYYVSIKAIDAYGNESIYSNEISAQPVLNAVTNLIITKKSGNIELSWSPSLGSESFKIYRGSSPNVPVTEMQFMGQTALMHWADFSATIADKYFYRVIATGY